MLKNTSWFLRSMTHVETRASSNSPFTIKRQNEKNNIAAFFTEHAFFNKQLVLHQSLLPVKNATVDGSVIVTYCRRFPYPLWRIVPLACSRMACRQYVEYQGMGHRQTAWTNSSGRKNVLCCRKYERISGSPSVKRHSVAGLI